jgi:uncharacterized protein (DUF2141 family)
MLSRPHLFTLAAALALPAALAFHTAAATALATAPLATEAAADRGFTLRVRVTGLDSNTGNVAVALFDSKDSFPDQKRALQGKRSKITKRQASVVFSGLEPGLYAVAVLHDANENNEMDFNFIGMPLEGYGFSNDASATFGPPPFSEAAFRLRPRASVIAVKARYFLP